VVLYAREQEEARRSGGSVATGRMLYAQARLKPGTGLSGRRRPCAP